MSVIEFKQPRQEAANCPERRTEGRPADPGREIMTCADFQQALPFIIDTGGEPAHKEHLKGCPVCSDLVADLRYIADQAKLLVPGHDPSPRVWVGIQRSLEREGLVKSAAAKRGLPEPHLL